jgi:hypothetical protein
MKTGFIQVNVQQEWNKIRVVRYWNCWTSWTALKLCRAKEVW